MNTEVNGYNIRYKYSGSGEKLAVVLQGWGTKLEVYDSVAASIGSKYRVLTFDLPGFGESTEPREAWSVDDYVDFFLAFMEKLGEKKAVLIGHSYGGRMIIKLAARHQKALAIEKIVLIDSAGIVPKKTFKQKFKIRKYKIMKKIMNLKIMRFIFGSVVDDWGKNQGSADYRAASPVMKKCLVKAVNEDLSECLPLVSEETLLIWGDKDTATPISDAKKMDSLLPNSGLAEIKGAGHYSFLEQPVLFGNIINAFL